MKRQRRRAFSSAVLLCLVLGFDPPGAAAQDLAIPDVTYPNLPRQAPSAEGFVPEGWVLEEEVSGDLNRDDVDDLAFVIRQKEPKNIIENTSLGENPFDTNPRILAVAFRRGPTGDYALQVENHTLIPRRTVPIADDPFRDDSVTIKRGGLHVKLYWWMSAGGWEMFSVTHIFQHRNGRFELIGFDRDTTHRGSGETRAVSVNYLTGRMKLTTGTIESDDTKVKWKTLPRRPPLTLDSVGDGLDFDPEH
ncbi:hypothetical protein [Microvirga pakistanensis]|uniref:hypothetical protein n=1 Tax=Microvirga pakistanensis TaxID=1682650 RepID=UPI00106CC408|nr:hypothetical protein [Microvirga pakistanensis]